LNVLTVLITLIILDIQMYKTNLISKQKLKYLILQFRAISYSSRQ
jgi:hypothetical protein